MTTNSEILVRVLVAGLIGAVIGAEREAADQPAGLRTHISVALGACLFGLVSTVGFAEFVTRRELTNVNVDVARVASNVVVGIGFLGAGVIFRQGSKVHNLTTAASLWVTSAVGLATGIGNFFAAVATAVVLVASLVLLRPVRHLIDRFGVHQRRDASVLLQPGAATGPLIEAMGSASEHVRIEEVRLGKEGRSLVVHATLRARPGHGCHECTDVLVHRDDVLVVRTEDDPDLNATHRSTE